MSLQPIPPELQLPVGSLLEGIVTTVGTDGLPNISPMGPIVDESFTKLRFRPFQTSTTYRNLKRTGEGVLHVTDDVELIAHAAVDDLDQLPQLLPAEAVQGFILADACRWYAFRVDWLDDRQERTEIIATVIDRGRLRDFFGFNRAKHAVVEAAILATRLDFLPADQVWVGIERFRTIVEKTAGKKEQRAFEFLTRFVERELGKQRQPSGT